MRQRSGKGGLFQSGEHVALRELCTRNDLASVMRRHGAKARRDA
jgi:hypothetical protein